MTAYYNDNEPFVAQWLRNLIGAGLVAPGDVDERPIEKVQADDVNGYTQCHFFAGIGGWPYALRLAGWPDDKPIWSASCPCQPVSSAGKRQGHADERHIWPAFHRLVAECRPSTIIGEQVASKDGREWFAGIRLDLEDLGYACGAADLCSAGVGAPNIRQRLFWMGDTEGQRRRRRQNDQDEGRRKRPLADTGSVDRMGETINSGLERHARYGNDGNQPGRNDANKGGSTAAPGNAGFWSDSEIVTREEGEIARVEPGAFPMAPRLPNHVGLLRAYGNAINPQVAAEFIKAFCECRP
jgi:DNA (cytosine-5)-methyltransferase 1